MGCQVVLGKGLVFPRCGIEYCIKVGGERVSCLATCGHLGGKNRVMVDISWGSWVKLGSGHEFRLVLETTVRYAILRLTT
jgi:hypothetical protein